MNSDRYIGNFGLAGTDRLKFVPVDEVTASVVGKTKPAKGMTERQEFERVIAAIMGVVREFPEVLKRVMAALMAERELCST